jgi:hypothetical protein
VATAEVSNTVSMEQIKNLPILDRDDVLGIMQTKAGGIERKLHHRDQRLRTSYSNMTLDGVNIQTTTSATTRSITRPISCASARCGR